MRKTKFVYKFETGIVAHLLIDDSMPSEDACRKLCRFSYNNLNLEIKTRYKHWVCHHIALDIAGVKNWISQKSCNYIIEPYYGIIKLYLPSNLPLLLVSWVRNNGLQIT